MIPLAEAAPPADLVPSLAGAALRMLGAVALLAAAAWALLRWHKRAGGARRDVRVLDRAILARGASVALVSVAGRRLLLGVSADGVRLITDLEARPGAAGATAFDSLLVGLGEREEVSK